METKKENKTEKIDIWAEIGQTAGEIYKTYKGKGEFSLMKAAEASKSDSNVVAMALGWLAREGKLDVKKTKRAYEMKIVD